MGGLAFGLLGPMVVVGETGEIAIHGVVRRRLLVRLLIAANRPVAVERLREDLWEGEPPASAASTLKSHISLLRRSLGADRLSHCDGAYVLAVGPDELDITRFETEAAAGRALLRGGDMRGAAETLGRGLGWWRGRALMDVADTSWGEPEAVRLEELRAGALEGWLEARLALGESHEVIADAESAVAEHPLREGLWAKLITALYGCGRQADALRAYQRLRELLAEQLGIAPSPELAALEGAVLRQDLTLGPVYGSARPAPPRAGPTSNLPQELTSFISRPTEAAELASLLRQPGLVTLTGAGGTGKTRLALRAARNAEPECEGVWFCELASLDDPSQLWPELASAIGCADQAGVELAETVTRRLAEGTHLVLLDNCEHLLDAAAALVLRLLRSAPNLRVLATSRSPLGVEGEVVDRIPSMSVPGDVTGPEGLLAFESVRLFVERAKSQQAAFSLDESTAAAVAAVCARLDGIPLALELAAARLRTMSVADIERRLDDRFRLLTSGVRSAPARQQTLRSLIDWSYDLLDERERDTLGRLSVFPAGFDLAAAEAVAAGEQPPALDVIASLVDKSLVQADMTGVTARYRLLETVREYASATLGGIEAAEARAAHARHFLELVETAAPYFSGAGQAAWRAQLDADDDNLRAAFNTLLAAPEAEESLRFGAAVSRYWNSRGFYGDEMHLLEAALERQQPSARTPARSAALAAAGYLLFRRGETTRAQQRLNEALEIARDLGSASLAADALRTMAWVADRRGDGEAALALAREAVDEGLASGESHLISRAYEVRAAASQYHDPRAARADYAESLRYCQSAGDSLGQATVLNNLAILELEQGEHQSARSHFSQALAMAEDVRGAALLPFIEYGVGLAAALDEDYAAAEPAFTGALHAARRTGQRSLVAYALLGIAVTRAATGREADAAALLGASSALFDELGEQPERMEARLQESTLKALRAVLGEELEGAVEAGRRLIGTEVVRLASL
ncbi:MAG: BTAD domain-containing putative transcriptional regulator [Acidimicrobiales bacterium]|jgi:predicted ATPase/DNA-binding SARP family transcriptional activator